MSIDPDGIRRPGGDLHAWLPGTNQTLCGLALSKSSLTRFPHVAWSDLRRDVEDEEGRPVSVCRRCDAATGHPRAERRPRRQNARP
jgi:hypothetical protein